jgi:capsular polysaccharide biosynthesis protein
MEETIDLKDLFLTLKKRFILILLVGLITAGVVGVVSYFWITPVYQATSQILVNQGDKDSEAFDVNAVRTNIEMINTYSVIIKSPAIIEKVINKLDLNKTVNQVNNNVSINSQNNSQVFSIAVKDSNPKEAARIVNTISETFQQEIPSIMNVNNVSILSKAKVGKHAVPIEPNPLINSVIGLIAGLIAGAGIAFLLEFFDNTIKDEQDIEKILDLPILGVISSIENTKNAGEMKKSKSKSIGSETVES